MFEALTTEERKQAVDACQIIKAVGRASVSCLQRRMRLGYTQAAHIMDCLEEEGIVGLPNGGALRPIYADKLEEALSQPNNALRVQPGREADPEPACLALCKRCAAEQGRAAEWDAFHYGTNRRCDACDREGLCAMMPNANLTGRRK